MKRQRLLENQNSVKVGLGRHVNHQTKSKKTVNFLSALNIDINYDKVINNKKDIATTVHDKQETNEGVFAASLLWNNNPSFFAIDNTDLRDNTDKTDFGTVNPRGKKQRHYTAIALFQHKDSHAKVSVDTNIFIIFFLRFSMNCSRKHYPTINFALSNTPLQWK